MASRMSNFSKSILGAFGVLLFGLVMFFLFMFKGCGDVQDKLATAKADAQQYIGTTITTEAGEHHIVSYNVYSDVFKTENGIELSPKIVKWAVDATPDSLYEHVDTTYSLIDTIENEIDSVGSGE